MSGSRTLTLKLLADIDNFVKGTNQAEAQAQGLSGKIEKFGAAAKAAFVAAAAAAAAYAIKLGTDGVQAAIEDEQAQAKLARTLEAATGATNEQIAATEKFISKMQLATGVADTDLRNALSRLSLSTNDLTKAQDLLALALDVSKATGKDLDSVANALGKAYDGQTTALGKLGIGLSSAELKSMSFTQIQTKLSDLFGGAAARNADTFQGKIDILKQRFAEFQETIGNYLLPILSTLFTMIDTKLIPVLIWLKEHALDPIANAVMDNWDTFKGFFEFLSKTLVPFLGGAFAVAISVIGKAAGFVVDAVAVAIRALEPLINFAIAGINKIITGINFIKPGADIGYIPKLSTSGVSSSSSAASKIGTFTTPKISSPTSSSGISTASSSAGAAAAGSSSIVAGATEGAKILAGLPNMPSNAITVNVSGAIDPEGTARTIVNTLNNSFYRGTGGAGGLVE